tara:strand:- start:763 stop:1461 length:699 start_codon:yes stop_codon:yes gene_type:complete
MSRIISYPYDNDIKDGDAWIGSEASTGKTRQYTAQAVADYLNINGKISIGTAMIYEYVSTSLAGTGTMALQAGGGTTPFANVTSLTLSTNDKSGSNTTAFVNYLVGSDILINEQKNLLAFGHYTVESYTAVSADYYTITVSFNGGQGSLTPAVIYNLDNFLLAADAVGDLNFTFTQATAQSVWTITHNLGKFPSVSIIDSAGTNVIGQVDYTNNNELILTFTAAFAGVAYLN